ncbi:MAG: riboflavin biosynthesis protein RibBA [Candidatus Binatia bacterium]|nr:MAG: riboflavin biosynthesis protein RibBA [Candidatus Binatia bacterium]
MTSQSLEAASTALREGRTVILTEGGEGEAVLCLAAELVTAEAINFMATHARGLVELVLPREHMQRLGIPLLGNPDAPLRKPYGASFEARRGVTTGISAADRATTIRAAVAEDAGPDDIVMPGHMFPVMARPGGVLAWRGLPEASVDLVRIAGLKPAAVTCTILDDAGNVATEPDVQALAELFDLPLVSVDDVVAHRLRSDSLVHRVVDVPMVTAFGAKFRMVVYSNDVDSHEHIAVIKGKWKADEAVLVRVHSECLTGDVFGSQRCDCGDQLRRALEHIDQAGKGVLVYMQQEGRGIGLANKVRAYALQDRGRDTVEANRELGFADDGRDYGMTAQILRDLGVRRVRLLTNNPRKIQGLEHYGIEVVERVPLEVVPHKGNLQYLRTKRQKMGHLLSNVDQPHQE